MKLNKNNTGVLFYNIYFMSEHRLKQLAEALRLSVNQLEKEVGVGASTFNKAIQRGGNINKGIALMIIQKYPNVNMDWLLTGEGDMFLPTDGNKRVSGKDLPHPKTKGLGNRILTAATQLFKKIPDPVSEDIETLNELRIEFEQLQKELEELKKKEK